MAKRSARKHRVRRVVHTATSCCWGILPEKLDQIANFLNLRGAGYELTRAEIAAAFGERTEDNRPRPQIVAGVAILPLYGTMMPRANMMLQTSGGTSTQEFGGWYRQALANPAVKVILIDCDSGGGMIPGTAELADLIYAGRGQKPSYTIVNPLCASAAYWVGSSTGQFIVSTSSRTGSVGCIYMHQESSKQLEAIGVKVTMVAEPQYKGEGNPFEPLSADARQHMEEKCRADYHKFLAALARNRGMDIAKVHANFGQGRTLFAEEAVAAGMADRVATFDELVNELSQGAGNPTSVTVNQPLALNHRQTHAKECGSMWEKIREALVARGLCAATASEADVRRIAGVFLAAHGQQAADDAALVGFLGALPVYPVTTPPPAPPVAPQTASSNPPPQPPAPIVGQVTPPVQPVAGQAPVVPTPHPIVPTPAPAPNAANPTTDAILAERERCRQIRSRGTLLGVDPAAVEAAIDSGVSLGTALESFTAQLATRNAPVQTVIGGDGASLPSVVGSPLDRVVEGASEALFARICASDIRHVGRQVPQLSPQARQFERMNLMQVAAASLSVRGYRAHAMDQHDVAIAFLQLAGRDLVPMSPMAASVVPGNSPASYPNLLSVLGNKVMDAAVEFAEATYPLWTYGMDPVPDFKPVTFVQLGSMGELPFHKDGDIFDEGQYGEEASWVATDSFGRELKVTPMMVVNNNLTSFAEMFEDTMVDHELTVNRLAVDLISGNPVLPDGVALFHATHGNLIAGGSGGPPSTAQASLMRKAMRKQLHVGGKRRLRLGMQYSLVPTDLETVNEQTFAPLTIVPVTDGTTNPFRAKVTPVVEAMLDDASTAVWFGFADPRRVRTVVVAFQQGFQNGGKRMSYFRPENQSQIFQIEGRFGVAIRNFRGAVKNTGS